MAMDTLDSMMVAVHAHIVQIEEVDEPDLSEEEMLFDAVQRDRLHEAVYLLKSADVDINKCNAQQKTLLFMAMENCNAAMVTQLLEHGADVNEKSYCSTYSTFESPLITAARLHNVQLMDMLIGCGALPMTEFGDLKEGKSALQWAATHGDMDMAQTLVNLGDDIKWIGPYFHTALHYAVLADQPRMVDWLLDNGAENCENGDGRTPLHLAAVKGHSECAYLLMDKGGHEIDLCDSYRCTPISLACIKGNIKLLGDMLRKVQRDSSFINHVNDGLRCAAEYGHIDVMKLLLSYKPDIDSTNDLGETALSLAARRQDEAMDVLIAHGASLTIADKRGYTPLYHALQRCHSYIPTQLIHHGAPVTRVSSTLDSPLKLAVNSSNPLLIFYILEAGCDLSQESWFTEELVQEKILEMHYKFPKCNMSLQSRYKDLWQAIIDKTNRPPTLMEACRASIRKALITGTKGTSIIEPIKVVGLPKVLESYLTIDSIPPPTLGKE